MSSPVLVRMPDQFTPGRGARAAATPSCCCCCCCVVSTVTASVVLPVSASRAVQRAAEQQPGQPAPVSAGQRRLGYVLLALAPLAAMALIVISIGRFGTENAMWVGLASGGIVGAALALLGDWLVGRRLVGMSAVLLAMFAAAFVVEVFLGLALVLTGWVYVVVAPLALVLILGCYLYWRGPR